MERVNKIVIEPITPHLSTRIKLMRTHTVLATITSDQIGVPTLNHMKNVGRTKYSDYLRDRVMRLLKDGKVEGFYWDDTHSDDNITKLTASTVCQAVRNMITGITEAMGVEIEFSGSKVHTIDVYKNGSICNGNVVYNILIKWIKHPSYIGQLELENYPINIQVQTDIKSGQLCKPRTFTLAHSEYPFTRHSIEKIIERRMGSGKENTST